MRAPNAAQMKMIEWRGLLPRKFLNRVQSRIWRNNSPPYMFWSFPSQHRGKVMVPVIASEKLERAHVQGSQDKSVRWAGAFATCGGRRLAAGR